MNIKLLVGFALLAALMVTGCMEDKTAAKSTETTTTKNTTPQQNAAATDTSIVTGNTIETFNAGGFTYVQITTPKESIWAAGPLTSIKKDDKVGFSRKMPMRNFHSKSLNRDFETIYFVDRFIVNGEASAPMQVPMTQNPHDMPAQN
jgi:PBP1b-binding outer membrane lipoprotein LpoB